MGLQGGRSWVRSGRTNSQGLGITDEKVLPYNHTCEYWNKGTLMDIKKSLGKREDACLFWQVNHCSLSKRRLEIIGMSVPSNPYLFSFTNTTIVELLAWKGYQNISLYWRKDITEKSQISLCKNVSINNVQMLQPEMNSEDFPWN